MTIHDSDFQKTGTEKNTSTVSNSKIDNRIGGNPDSDAHFVIHGILPVVVNLNFI